MGQTGGPDMAPFVAAVTVLAHVDVQWDVAAVVLGLGHCVEMVTDGLFFSSGLITGGLLVFMVMPKGLAWYVNDPGMAHLACPDVSR